MAHDAQKPRILFLVDKPGWAFDRCAQELTSRLNEEFHTGIAYRSLEPDIDPSEWDLLYVFFWGERWHRQFGFPVDRVIKEVSSHRFSDEAYFGQIDAQEMVRRHAHDAGTLVATSAKLFDALSPHHPHVGQYRLGVSLSEFGAPPHRNGPLVFGWAGNPNDTAKRYDSIIQPCARSSKDLVLATSIPPDRMAAFYRQIDVILIASQNEGTPLPLIEAMGCGVFPIATDVGVVPELIDSGRNGLIVSPNRQSFETAMDWCRQNPGMIRDRGRRNSELIAKLRNWDIAAGELARVLRSALEKATSDRASVLISDCRPSRLRRMASRLSAKITLLRNPGDQQEPLILNSPHPETLRILSRRRRRIFTFHSTKAAALAAAPFTERSEVDRASLARGLQS